MLCRQAGQETAQKCMRTGCPRNSSALIAPLSHCVGPSREGIEVLIFKAIIYRLLRVIGRGRHQSIGDSSQRLIHFSFEFGSVSRVFWKDINR